jgi:hypothetical protein
MYDTNFDASDAHYSKIVSLGDVQAAKFGNLKCFDCKDPKKKNQTNKQSAVQ